MICMCPRVRSPRSLSRRFGIVRCIPERTYQAVSAIAANVDNMQGSA